MPCLLPHPTFHSPRPREWTPPSHAHLPGLTCPHLPSPAHTCPHPSTPILTCPYLPIPALSCGFLSEEDIYISLSKAPGNDRSVSPSSSSTPWLPTECPSTQMDRGRVRIGAPGQNEGGDMGPWTERGWSQSTHLVSVREDSARCRVRRREPFALRSAVGGGTTGTTTQNNESRGGRATPEGVFRFCPNRNLSFPWTCMVWVRGRRHITERGQRGPVSQCHRTSMSPQTPPGMWQACAPMI